MAQTPILTPGTTARTSVSISIPENTVANFGIYTDNALGIPANEGAMVYADTPAQDILLATMTPANPTASVQGPADVIIKTNATLVALGVFRFT